MEREFMNHFHYFDTVTMLVDQRTQKENKT